MGNQPRKPLAKPGEVAEYIGKTVRALEQWRYRGAGPKFLKVGREVRYRWDDVDEWIAEQARTAA